MSGGPISPEGATVVPGIQISKDSPAHVQAPTEGKPQQSGAAERGLADRISAVTPHTGLKELAQQEGNKGQTLTTSGSVGETGVAEKVAANDSTPQSLALDKAKTSPPLALRQEHRRIGKPIDANETVDIPVTPMFVDRLPVVERAFGIKIGTDTYGKRTETVVVANLSRTSNPMPLEDVPIIARISQYGRFAHNRSFNYMESGKVDAEVIKIDGGEYSGVSVKGGDFGAAHIIEDGNYQSGIRINGLVTADIAERMVSTANWLWKNGIKSEIIWSVSRPNLLPVMDRVDGLDKPGGELFLNLLTPAEFKKRLVEQAQRNNQSHPANGQIDIDKARRYLESTDFVVINRATTVPFRLSDLPKPFGHPKLRHQPLDAHQEFFFMMNNMFSYLNRDRNPQDQFEYLQLPKSKGDEQTIESNEQQLNKFFDYFARNLGTQVGLLHGKGVAHGFLHTGNITADGTFVDLDSPHGAPLGDKPITPGDISSDIGLVIADIHGILGRLGQDRIISADLKDRITQTFLNQYADTRWGQDSAVKTAGIENLLQEIISIPANIEFSNIRRRLTINSYRRWLRKKIRDPLLRSLKSERPAA